jgi:hypothetical protein
MSVNWQDETSPARVKAIKAAEVSGEFDHTVPTWGIYADLREALIYALLVTGFPARSEWAITEKNWEQLFVRLSILETVRSCYRVYNNGDLASREVRFTPEEIKSMVGLSVNAGNKTDLEFSKHLYRLLERDAKDTLHCFNNPSERTLADPYYWENLFDPEREA